MIRPIVKIHGGKRYLFKWILENFPTGYEEMKYVETCGGACSVLLNKIRSKSEIYNDLDITLYNLLYYLKNEPDKFMAEIADVQYNEETYKKAAWNIKNKKAWGFGLHGAIDELIIRRMSRGGLRNSFGWSNRKRGGKPGDVNAWDTFKLYHLPMICERLKNVELRNEHVADLVKNEDSENTLFYIDPPYLHSTRSVPAAYNVEMTEGEHLLLSQVLQDVKGKVVLSGYYSQLYAKLYKGWTMVAKEVANHAGQAKKKQRRIECLWMNF